MDTAIHFSAEQAEQVEAEQSTPFEFTGKGGEFFRIWIVNLFLTIITLGIYSAWAKVRTLNYFYGNTQLEGNAFSYLASPITILKGRLVALAFLVAYGLASEFYPIAGALMSLVILALFPWLITRSLRFNAINSAYRNVRFDFHGNWSGAAMAFLVWPLIGMLTLFILFPVAMKKQNEYLVTNFSYGTARFEFNASTGAFYQAFFGAMGIFILAGILTALANGVGPAPAILVLALGYLVGFAWMRAKLFNVVYQGSSLDQHGFEADMTADSYTRLIIVNLVCMVLTLGLFYPFAKVRTARYTAEHLRARLSGSLDAYVAGEAEKVSAVGDELADAMDLDIGL